MSINRWAPIALLFLVVSHHKIQVQAQNKLTLPHDQAVLEYPRGRFIETAPPQFFKWTLVNPVETVSLKVYKKAFAGSGTEDDQLLGKYDFTSETQSHAWTSIPFSPGEYYWVIETFNEENAQPINRSTSYFHVEKIKSLNLQSGTMGPVLGFGIGSYLSSDTAYQLNFDTTPRVYGANIRMGSEKRLIETSLLINDYSVASQVRYPLTIKSNYLWKIYGKSPYIYEVYLGPHVRFHGVPEVRTTDGTTFSVSDLSFINPGATVAIHKQISSYMTIHGNALIDTPVWSPNDVTPEVGQINYTLSAGLFFNVIWPLGFNGELQYRSFGTTYESESEDVEVLTETWVVIGQVIYTF